MNESKLRKFLQGFRGLYAFVGLLVVAFLFGCFLDPSGLEIPTWIMWASTILILLLGELFYCLDIRYKIFYRQDLGCDGKEYCQPSENFIVIKIINAWRGAGVLGILAIIGIVIYAIIYGIILIAKDPKSLTALLLVILTIAGIVAYFISNYYLAKHLEKKHKKSKKK